MKVKVLQKDIDKAVRIIENGCGIDRNEWSGADFGNVDLSVSCPISQAIRRITKKRVTTSDSSDISVGKREYIVKESQEKMVDSFIERFDDGKKVKSIEFEMVVNN